MTTKQLAVAATWAWVILLVLATPAWAQEKMIFTFGTAGQYSTSLGILRNSVKGATPCQNLPMLSGDNKYLLVQLGTTDPIIITIHLKTMYVEGYSDVYQGKCRSFVTSDASSGSGSSLCGSSVQATNLGFKGSYDGLLGAVGGGVTRLTFLLGIEQLKARMKAIYGQSYPIKKAQAEFMLTVVEMVAEAARFTYIERQVGKWVNFYPNVKMDNLVTEWGKISTAIGMANNNGEIPANYQPKDLINEDGSPRTVTKVSDIRGDVGLINKVNCLFSGVNFFPDQLVMSYIMEENNIMGEFEGL